MNISHLFFFVLLIFCLTVCFFSLFRSFIRPICLSNRNRKLFFLNLLYMIVSCVSFCLYLSLARSLLLLVNVCVCVCLCCVCKSVSATQKKTHHHIYLDITRQSVAVTHIFEDNIFIIIINF